jgi:ribosomal-protein-alanine N-acetyltransferase
VIELRPMTPAFIEAVLEDRRNDAAALLDLELPDEFPREGERRFLALRLRQMREDQRFQTWCPSVVVLDGRMIGHAGYHGPPGVNSTRNEAAVEFGYVIYPEWRGRGYATQAARMLMDQAEGLAGIHRFVLAVSPDNDPSLAIVRKLGFVRTGEQIDEEDGLEHIYELERGAP